MQDLNFNEFDKVTEKAWKQKIQADLKGKDYGENMLTHTEHNIDIKPFYHKESNIDINVPNPKKWFVTKHITDSNYQNWNTDLQAGIESFWLSLDKIDLFANISRPDIPLIIQYKSGDITKFNLSEHTLCAFDPLNEFARTGNWIQNQEADFNSHKKYVEHSNSIALDIRLYHDAGGNIIQQLAYGLSHLAAYFRALHFKDQQSLNIIVFNSVGTNYFFEIAKIKALKILLNSLCTAENIKHNIKIVSTPGLIDYSIYDYNVNMLRSTSMSMSAVLGGSDFVCNLPYDRVFKNTNEFSQRIAKNQLLILKHESYFDKVENPTDGSYYINSLTKSMAEQALELFKDIEKSGGFIQQLFDGKIQSKLHEQFSNLQQHIAAKKKIMVGVNKYPNEEERLHKVVEKPLSKIFHKRKTLIKPIIERRYSSKLEDERLKTETN